MRRFAVMIFAAGFGARMGDLTKDRPKPLITVAGRALIDHALDLVGRGPVVVNLHYKGAQMEHHLKGRDVRLAWEPEILETGGGLKAALPLLGAGPVMTLNSDAVWTGDNPLKRWKALGRMTWPVCCWWRRMTPRWAGRTRRRISGWARTGG